VQPPPTPFKIAADWPAAFRRRRESNPFWGTIRRRLSFGLRTFFVTFLLAAVYKPILGLDFSAHGLLVDPVSRQVLDSKTLKPLSKPSTAAGTLRSKFAAALCSIAPSVRSLLASFQPSSKHKIRHIIETTGRPMFILHQLTSDISHTLGQENVVADALSLPPPAAAKLPPPSQRPSPALAAEDWQEEGLATQEQPILAAIANAQPVDF
jgi:hypothetical protein